METQPVQAAPYLEPERRTWPTVIGILAVLWGGIGLISAVAALAGVGQQEQPPFMRAGVGAALTAAGAAAAALLVLAGVQLLRRRAASIQLMRAWIPLTLVVQLGSIGFMATHREEFEAAMRDRMEEQAEKAGAKAPQLPAGFERFMVTMTLACGGVLAVVPPAVAAIFVFGRRGREALVEWQVPGSGV